MNWDDIYIVGMSILWAIVIWYSGKFVVAKCREWKNKKGISEQIGPGDE